MYSQYVYKNSASVMIQGLLKREKGPSKKNKQCQEFSEVKGL